MVIDDNTRKKLLFLLEGVNYRQIISDKCHCHPNTVSNVLLKGHDNLEVATALINLGKEQKSKKQQEEIQRRKALATAKQL